MSNPRDPRQRRQMHRPGDALAAAVRLDLAVDAMRAQQLDRGPEVIASAAQLGTHEPRLTAAEFAAALDAADEELQEVAEVLEVLPVEESAAPPPAADPAPPAPPVAAPVAFDSERLLTWRSRHDERSRAYGVRATLTGSAPVQDRLWPVGPVLDQGTEGACVGCAVVDAANVLELTVGLDVVEDGRPLGLADATELYHRAQRLDEVPGEAYSGTSVLAGMKAAVEAGLFGGYLWAFGTRDVAQAVLQRGPVVIGVPWLSGMYDTGPGGLVTLTGHATGQGHCLAVVGMRRTGPQGQPGPFFVWQNSWGPGYGDGGLGYIHHRDLAALLHGSGEAAIPTAEPQTPR